METILADTTLQRQFTDTRNVYRQVSCSLDNYTIYNRDATGKVTSRTSQALLPEATGCNRASIQKPIAC